MRGLTDVTEDSMIAAHKAGIAYWNRNKPGGASNESIESLARSLGYHDGDMLAFCAGLYGAERRATRGGL
jgi:hypothetical protein